MVSVAAAGCFAAASGSRFSCLFCLAASFFFFLRLRRSSSEELSSLLLSSLPEPGSLLLSDEVDDLRRLDFFDRFFAERVGAGELVL